ncbi:MAG: hypothetical protein PWP28_250 [Oceanotoga sp.]|uniref:glycosyltransferase family 2 protein n=1 Tax=Oceanotoga sp. TaxID=2108366 RepID=UPI00264B7E62|nr:glycosyltransferase [Oceanotoga sp.]MDN5341375.1 hypothetical protein [Oceanotoga sp.]
MKLSIIVPAYNAKKFIDRCIHSIIGYQYEYEIIIINDGSKDKTLEIINKYNKYDNIRIYNQENKGLSETRNRGINLAKGHYIFFLDSDDFINMENLIEMVEYARNKNLDIIEGRIINYYSKNELKYLGYYIKKKIQNKLNKKILNGEEFFNVLVKNNNLIVSACSRVYKRSFLINNDLFFYKGILHEDNEFTPKVILKANKISLYNKTFYYRTHNQNSLTENNKDLKRYEGLLISSYRNYLLYKKNKNKMLKNFYSRLFLSAFKFFKENTIDKNKIKEYHFEKFLEIKNNIELKYKIFFYFLKYFYKWKW